MYCCSLLQNIILRQLFGTCNNHIFTTYTGIQNISHSYCAYEIKTGSKLKTSGRRLKLSSFRLSFFLCKRVEREGLHLASNLHFSLPGSSLGSYLTDQQIDQHGNQACSEWFLSLCFLDNFRPQIVHL